MIKARSSKFMLNVDHDSSKMVMFKIPLYGGHSKIVLSARNVDDNDFSKSYNVKFLFIYSLNKYIGKKASTKFFTCGFTMSLVPKNINLLQFSTNHLILFNLTFSD